MTDFKAYDLILMIVIIFLVIKHIAHIPHDFDGTIPGRTHKFLFFFQEDNIIDRVIVNGIWFGFAAIDSIEEIDVIVP